MATYLEHKILSTKKGGGRERKGEREEGRERGGGEGRKRKREKRRRRRNVGLGRRYGRIIGMILVPRKKKKEVYVLDNLFFPLRQELPYCLPEFNANK